jgi:hypothetical protein
MLIWLGICWWRSLFLTIEPLCDGEDVAAAAAAAKAAAWPPIGAMYDGFFLLADNPPDPAPVPAPVSIVSYTTHAVYYMRSPMSLKSSSAREMRPLACFYSLAMGAEAIPQARLPRTTKTGERRDKVD